MENFDLSSHMDHEPGNSLQFGVTADEFGDLESQHKQLCQYHIGHETYLVGVKLLACEREVGPFSGIR
jgi:hypothetical protein